MKTLNFYTGWNLKGIAVNASVLLMCMYSVNVFAEPTESPSIELLEFIGDGVDVENEYVDPLGYYEMQQVMEMEKKQQEKQEHE